jgi:hypothetical protein
MPTVHRVQQGECLASIAHRYGVMDWRRILDHPDNDALREKRPDPHVLAPGDTVVVPDKEERVADVATGKEHKFKVKLPRVKLRLHLHGRDGEPLAGKRYELTVAGSTVSGTTAGDGLLEEEVPADATTGTLRVFASDDDPEHGTRIELAIGHLDPIDHDEGARARLRNLGFLVKSGADDADGRSLAKALRWFQKQHGLEVTGELDDATADALRGAHKS